MREYVDCDAPDGVERGEQVERVLRREAEDGAAAGDDDECLLVATVVRLDVADRRARELLRELAEATRKVVS